MRSDLYNLTPAHFYSTADAINKHMQVIKTNHLESLSEAGELLSIVPDVTAAVSLLTSFNARKAVQYGGKLLDFATGEWLRYSFGSRPSVEGVLEFADAYDGVVAKLRESGIFGSFTLYGKFSYQLPEGTYGVDSATLLVRTKTRVKFSRNSLLALMLKGEAVGLAPTLSRLWDVVPFSFVVDWGFNIGGRLQAVDDRVRMLLLDCDYCVHSTSVIHNFSDELLEEYCVHPSGNTLGFYPHVKFYDRFVSRRFPPLRESKYDFLEPQHRPSLVTVGSLVYQLFK